MNGRTAYELLMSLTDGKARWDDLLPGEQDAWERVAKACKTPADALSLTMMDCHISSYTVRVRCAGCGETWRFSVDGEGVGIECPTCSGISRARNKATREETTTDTAATPKGR